MSLDASLDAALRGAAPLVCVLLKIELPGHTILLVDGVGEVTYDGETYTGEDEVYGVLDSVEGITEQVGTEAPTVRFTFLPATLSALADITDPANQGSRVYVRFGAIDPATGLLIGEPELLFLGELDTAEVEAGEASTVIAFDVVSAWERLFEANEGRRLNDKYWQSLYSGARGMQYVTEIQRDLPWGYDAPRPRVVSDTVGGVQPGRGGGSPIGGGGRDRLLDGVMGNFL
ncbi:hypothetical protein [Phenylobacterium sp.]|uniref:hypothetical protein n=1 Tax=Phenylobacterium sp. TaxID=1871053 RepID=UPI002810E8C8|nr:hypothetical protein [Phenylobacterium sp.]